MQNAGIYPSLVENTAKFGLGTGQSNGTTRVYDEFNDVTIVLNSKGDVITTWWGGGVGK